MYLFKVYGIIGRKGMNLLIFKHVPKYCKIHIILTNNGIGGLLGRGFLHVNPNKRRHLHQIGRNLTKTYLILKNTVVYKDKTLNFSKKIFICKDHNNVAGIKIVFVQTFDNLT